MLQGGDKQHRDPKVSGAPGGPRRVKALEGRWGEEMETERWLEPDQVRGVAFTPKVRACSLGEGDCMAGLRATVAVGLAAGSDRDGGPEPWDLPGG